MAEQTEEEGSSVRTPASSLYLEPALVKEPLVKQTLSSLLSLDQAIVVFYEHLNYMLHFTSSFYVLSAAAR